MCSLKKCYFAFSVFVFYLYAIQLILETITAKRERELSNGKWFYVCISRKHEGLSVLTLCISHRCTKTIQGCMQEHYKTLLIPVLKWRFESCLLFNDNTSIFSFYRNNKIVLAYTCHTHLRGLISKDLRRLNLPLSIPNALLITLHAELLLFFLILCKVSRVSERGRKRQGTRL